MQDTLNARGKGALTVRHAHIEPGNNLVANSGRRQAFHFRCGHFDTRQLSFMKPDAEFA